MVARYNVPAEFYDFTDSKLLAQPEPQYLYAQLLIGALGASLPVPSVIGNPQRPVGGQGAPYSSADRDELVLARALPSELVAAAIDFKGKPGSTVRINRPVFTNTTYTKASRKIVRGSSISTTPIQPQSQQTNMTLELWGGPYSTDASAVAPYSIEAFDSGMGVHNLAQLVGTHLSRDFHRFLDSVAVVLADTASTTKYPDGMTAVNDATYSGMFPFTFDQLLRTEAAADEANLPTLPDGFRLAVMTPTQVRQLGVDPLYGRSAFVHPGYSNLFPGYVKSVSKTHVFKDTTLATTANTSSVAIHRGHYIAPGAFMVGMGRPPRTQFASDDNYGETQKVIWLADMAFELANNTMVISMKSSA
jgi:hypothetical protein